MARTLWWSSDGKVMIDLDSVVSAIWFPEDERHEAGLEVTFRGDSVPQGLSVQNGNELMAALREHAGWPAGSPYRG